MSQYLLSVQLDPNAAMQRLRGKLDGGDWQWSLTACDTDVTAAQGYCDTQQAACDEGNAMADIFKLTPLGGDPANGYLFETNARSTT